MPVTELLPIALLIKETRKHLGLVHPKASKFLGSVSRRAHVHPEGEFSGSHYRFTRNGMHPPGLTQLQFATRLFSVGKSALAGLYQLISSLNHE